MYRSCSCFYSSHFGPRTANYRFSISHKSADGFEIPKSLDFKLYQLGGASKNHHVMRGYASLSTMLPQSLSLSHMTIDFHKQGLPFVLSSEIFRVPIGS
ncbi:hypothetical protein AAG906_020421 [Vitis piasezkii]